MLTYSCTRNVGIGSSEQDLTGDVMTIRFISVCVHGQNDASDDVAGARTGGKGRPAVSCVVNSCLTSALSDDGGQHSSLSSSV